MISRQWKALIALAVIAIALAWHAGTFDDALVHVGLNAKPCIRNAYGATFCGSSAVSYCESLPAEAPAPMCANLPGVGVRIPTGPITLPAPTMPNPEDMTR